ncbi:hypothetical protein AXF42_Ash011006 [Apostasia shenzhenica]|uniref:Uncharacterized protein n=1 Tax=Apostasia shenzhenica TaxID=1088818 RepID=A0A2H9ZQV4_9ASPA|nr:hypothetical protein AXF42_Ash011006 [Apostasia shenzhenica]
MLLLIAVVLLVVTSLQLPAAMAMRPLEGDLGFSIGALLLESLPMQGPAPPSGHSCETHSDIPCPPP